MLKKKSVIIWIIISAVVLALAWYVAHYEDIGLCQVNDVHCGNYYEAIVTPTIFFSASILLSVIFLLFLSEDTYKKWRKFALWAIPMGIIILFLAPSDSSTSMAIGKDFSKETASWLVSGLFLIISLIIIIRKSLKSIGSQP